MSIAVDASTPALVTGTSSATTASFTAPIGSLLVALWSITFGAGSDTLTNSGTALTWTSRQNSVSNPAANIARIETAPVLTSAARTVTAATTTGSPRTALKLLVLTGVDLAAPVGAGGKGSSTTQNLSAGYTSTVDDSFGVGWAIDENNAAAPSSADVGYAFNNSTYGGIAVHKAAPTPAAGTSVTLNFNGTGASRNWNWAVIEVLPLIVPFAARRGKVLSQAVSRAANW